MGLKSWIAKLLGFGPLPSPREEEQNLQLYLTRLEDRHVLNAAFAASGTNLNLTNFSGSTSSVTVSDTGTASGNYIFTLNAGTWSGSNVVGVVSGSGTSTLTVNKSAITGNISINDGAGSPVDVQFSDADNQIVFSSLTTLQLSQVGAVTQGAATSLTTTNFTVGNVANAASVTLDTVTNDFQGAVILNTTGGAKLRDANDLTLGASNVGGTLDVIFDADGVDAANTLATTGQIIAGTVNNFQGNGNDTIKLGRNVTAPTIVFNENVVLATDVTITGNAVFNGKVDALAAGVQGLTVTGNVQFNGLVGSGTALKSVSVTGNTTFNAAGTVANPTVKTTGAQQYGDNASDQTTLQADTVLTAGTTVTFTSALDATTAGVQLLDVQGSVVFNARVGDTVALKSLNVTGNTTLAMGGSLPHPTVTTTGTQQYGDGVGPDQTTLNGNVVLKGTTSSTAPWTPRAQGTTP